MIRKFRFAIPVVAAFVTLVLGANAALVRNGNETSGSVDIKAVFNWLASEGWLTNATLSSVDFGWEISSTNDTTENFQVNSYSLSYG